MRKNLDLLFLKLKKVILGKKNQTFLGHTISLKNLKKFGKPSLKPHIFFYMNRPVVWHSLRDIRDIKVNMADS